MALEDQLQQVEQLIDDVQVDAAQGLFSQLIQALSPHELEAHNREIERTLSRFLPKRRSQLQRLVSSRIASPQSPPSAASLKALDDFELRVRSTLAELAESRPFQWATYYRDALHEINQVVRSLSIPRSSAEGRQLLGMLREEFEAHSANVFQNFFDAGMERSPDDLESDVLVMKCRSGLSRFLELLVESFRVAVAGSADSAAAHRVYAAVSAELAGVLKGFAQVDFGDQSGGGLLCSDTNEWGYVLGFLEATDAADVLTTVNNCDSGISLANLIPLLNAIETVNTGQMPLLPTMSVFDGTKRELTVRLEQLDTRGAGRPIEVRVDLSGGEATRVGIERAHTELVSLYVGRLPDDLKGWLASRPTLQSSVVDLGTSAASPAHPIVNAIAARMSGTDSGGGSTTPFTWNVAREFPLNSPFVNKYYRVQRKSVRDLFSRCDGLTGVRLWCSVRRSGKTTACFDIESYATRSFVITQTGTRTGQFSDANVLFDRVTEHIESGTSVPRDFLSSFVDQQRGPLPESRTILLIDEYETLFSRMHYAIADDPALQFKVVQPILDQMVEFSRENLLVLVGQWPDAHYVAMDQNQLSAYVEQDHFPLFEHTKGHTYGEYWDLMKRIFQTAVEIRPSFVDTLHKETGGHPFLTVQLSISILDWVIRHRRPVGKPVLEKSDFQEFASTELTKRAISSSPEYQFFRNVAAEALSDHGATRTPWLHAIYAALKQIALDYPQELACTRGEFDTICRGLRTTETIGYDSSSLLTSGVMTNFLLAENTRVRAAIPVLARIASVAQAKKVW